MILVYMDETGDTGNNLKDPQQPIFILGALLIPQDQWKELEKSYNGCIQEAFSGKVPENFELHTMDLVNGRKAFRPLTLQQCCKLRDDIIALVDQYKLKFIYRKIIKKDLAKYVEENLGKGISVDPYLFALPFIFQGTEEILKEEKDLGIFIMDEHNKNYFDVEQSLKTLRMDQESVLHLQHVIEKGFFIDSSKSFAIQIVDLCLYYLRKWEEQKLGKKVSPIHAQTFPAIEKMAIDLGHHPRFRDILEWVNDRWNKK